MGILLLEEAAKEGKELPAAQLTSSQRTGEEPARSYTHLSKGSQGEAVLLQQ